MSDTGMSVAKYAPYDGYIAVSDKGVLEFMTLCATTIAWLQLLGGG
jgi:hypothetical protein